MWGVESTNTFEEISSLPYIPNVPCVLLSLPFSELRDYLPLGPHDLQLQHKKHKAVYRKNREPGLSLDPA